MAIAKSDHLLWEALAALPLDRLAEDDTGTRNGFTHTSTLSFLSAILFDFTIPSLIVDDGQTPIILVCSIGPLWWASCNW